MTHEEDARRHAAMRAYLLPACLLSIMALAVLLVVLLPGAEAYDFELASEEVTVSIRRDGSVDIDYLLRFVNYEKLDGVDVGLPNRFYDADTAWAYIEVGDQRYEPREIRKSPYVEIGLAVEFTDACRRAASVPGTEVVVRFHVNNPHMVYLNEQREGTVGIRFRPTWFDPDYQRNPTGSLTVHVVMPPGHTDANATYWLRGNAWDSIYLAANDRLLATWHWEDVPPEAQADGLYDVGVAFPKRHVDTYFEDDFWDRAHHSWLGMWDSCGSIWPILLLILVLIVVALYLLRTSQRRQLEYFDPEMCVPGAGPRRDLTAVEAAVTLEVPIDRVATMILFGLIRKDLVKLDTESDPPKVEKLSAVGHYMYETRYLSAITSDGRVSRRVLKRAMIKLVEDVQEKLKGFGIKDTRTFYRAVVERAWEQVKEAGTPEELAASLKKSNEWMMIDEDYEDRMTGLFVPVVAGGGDPGNRGDLQAMAQGFVDQLRTTTSGLVRDLSSLTREVTEVTNPIPTGDGAGGGGCACACACACAGGGR